MQLLLVVFQPNEVCLASVLTCRTAGMLRAVAGFSFPFGFSRAGLRGDGSRRALALLAPQPFLVPVPAAWHGRSCLLLHEYPVGFRAEAQEGSSSFIL